MKKFLSMLIIFFALAFVFPQNVFAADVPSFLALDSENISLVHKDYSRDLNCTFYVYECAPNTAENFVKQFATQVVNTGLFKVSLNGQFKYDYSEEIADEVYFKYTGAKKVKKIYGIDLKKHNLKIERSLDQAEYLVVVTIPDGLSYADENAPVVPSTSTQPSPAIQTQPAPVETVPVQNVPVANDSADVPDFLQVCDENVSYSGNQPLDDYGTLYSYDIKNLSFDLSNDYIEKYIRLLTGRYNFVQNGHEEKDFGETKFDKWTFRYIGSKNVKASSGGYHLELKRFRDYEKNRVYLEFAVAKGLTVAGNYEPPKTSSSNGKSYCSACGGSGRCSTCGGNGYYHYSGFDQPCGSCLATGKCSYCNGTGYK